MNAPRTAWVLAKWLILGGMGLAICGAGGLWLYWQRIGLQRGDELGQEAATEGNIGNAPSEDWAHEGWRQTRWGMAPRDVAASGVLAWGEELEPVVVSGMDLLTNYRGPLAEPFLGFYDAVFSFNRRGLFAIGVRQPKGPLCLQDQLDFLAGARSFGGRPYSTLEDSPPACKPDGSAGVQFCTWLVRNEFKVKVARYGRAGDQDCWSEFWIERPLAESESLTLPEPVVEVAEKADPRPDTRTAAQRKSDWKQWTKEERKRVLGLCESAGGNDDEVCECSLTLAMLRWPRVAAFHVDLATDKGAFELAVIADECRTTRALRREAAKLLAVKLGTGWAPISAGDRDLIAIALGYPIDAGFVFGTAGVVEGADAIITVRVAPAIVGSDSFRRSMTELDVQKFCGRGSIGGKYTGSFDPTTLTYSCEKRVGGGPGSSYPRRSWDVRQLWKRRLVRLDVVVQRGAPEELDRAVERTVQAMLQSMQPERWPSSATSR